MKAPYILGILFIVSTLFLGGCGSSDSRAFVCYDESHIDKDCASLVDEQMRKGMRAGGYSNSEFVQVKAEKAKFIAYSPSGKSGMAIVKFKVTFKIPNKFRENRFLFFNQIDRRFSDEEWNRFLSYVDGGGVSLVTFVNLQPIEKEGKNATVRSFYAQSLNQRVRYSYGLTEPIALFQIYTMVGLPFLRGASVEEVQHALSFPSSEWIKDYKGPCPRYPYFSKNPCELDGEQITFTKSGYSSGIPRKQASRNQPEAPSPQTDVPINGGSPSVDNPSVETTDPLRKIHDKVQIFEGASYQGTPNSVEKAGMRPLPPVTMTIKKIMVQGMETPDQVKVLYEFSVTGGGDTTSSDARGFIFLNPDGTARSFLINNKISENFIGVWIGNTQSVHFQKQPYPRNPGMNPSIDGELFRVK